MTFIQMVSRDKFDHFTEKWREEKSECNNLEVYGWKNEMSQPWLQVAEGSEFMMYFEIFFNSFYF